MSSSIALQTYGDITTKKYNMALRESEEGCWVTCTERGKLTPLVLSVLVLIRHKHRHTHTLRHKYYNKVITKNGQVIVTTAITVCSARRKGPCLTAVHPHLVSV